MRLLLLAFLVGFFSNPLFADQSRDVAAIKQQVGCFQVDFKFDETIPNVNSSNQAFIPRQNYHDHVAELVTLEKDTPREISLVHTLLIGKGPFPVMKHWRQTWVFESDTIFEYQGDYRWSKRSLNSEERSGSWVQKVSRIDDGPNRECVGKWEHGPSGARWNCKSLSPILRRDYPRSKAFDYNIHSHAYSFTNNSIYLGESIEKVKRTSDGLETVVLETGGGHYQRSGAPVVLCEQGLAWWKKYQSNWNEVYLAWSEIFERNEQIQLKHVLSTTSENVKIWKNLWAKLYGFAVPSNNRIARFSLHWMSQKSWSDLFWNSLPWFGSAKTKTPMELIEEDWKFSPNSAVVISNSSEDDVKR